jgi:hypothetical protein
MPTGPKGQKGPANVIGNAIKVARIATGERGRVHRNPAEERSGGGAGAGRGAQAGRAERRREESCSYPVGNKTPCSF